MKQYTIIYQGKQLSNNQMKGGQWRKIKETLVDPLKMKAAIICKEAKPIKMQKFTVEARYNSRLDPDNISATIKVFIDQLVKMEVLPSDDKRYWKGLTIIPDQALKHNSLTLTVREAE